MPMRMFALIFFLGLCGCDELSAGACVYQSGDLFYCSEDPVEACKSNWCSGANYCAFFAGDTCPGIDFSESSRSTFAEPRTPDDGFGMQLVSNTGGGNGGGGGSTSGTCATYSAALGRAVCEPNSTSASCSGHYLGDGTSCSAFTCSTPTDPSTCSAGGGNAGGGGGTTSDCNNAWTCATDGQATPMCQAACAYSGSQRTFTCGQLVTLVGSSTASSCCTVCR